VRGRRLQDDLGIGPRVEFFDDVVVGIGTEGDPARDLAADRLP